MGWVSPANNNGWRSFTPLCPAGHLPPPISDVAGRAPPMKRPISPLAGEMPGRAEGGAQVLSSPLSDRLKRRTMGYTIPPLPPATAGRSPATLAR
ncbi:MAG: hypothetical protein E5Y06_23525 [Mesorhizobium sp.]|nr:MAG: hypothetical protein E5Y06_23525 [Mesorhizobium sp.]TJU97798.1 MAG: hypothetical protein E5Y08_15410 [Mesorhizobium sp.]TJV15037.1 MAG: hypothetical protein E5Y07_24090 [Mesorhizobium sp.]